MNEWLWVPAFLYVRYVQQPITSLSLPEWTVLHAIHDLRKETWAASDVRAKLRTLYPLTSTLVSVHRVLCALQQDGHAQSELNIPGKSGTNESLYSLSERGEHTYRVYRNKIRTLLT